MDYRDRDGNRGPRRDDRGGGNNRQGGGGGGGGGGSRGKNGYAGYGVFQRGGGGLGDRELTERDFYKESKAQKTATLNCSGCRTQDTYELTWILRHRVEKLPGGADEALRAKFAKAQSYMVLIDDYATCKSCRKRFEVSGIKTMAFL